MEHSALHALLLTGLIAALGGGLAMVWIILPSLRASGPKVGSEPFTADLAACIARWVFRGALAAAVASGVDIFVEVAELQGLTVFGGVQLETVARNHIRQFDQLDRGQRAAAIAKHTQQDAAALASALDKSLARRRTDLPATLELLETARRLLAQKKPSRSPPRSQKD